MSSHEGSELERTLRTALAELAPEPRDALLDRTLVAVAETPQRPRTAPFAASGAGWKWAAASVVLAAGAVVGIAIGSTVDGPIGDRPELSSAPATLGTSDSPPPSAAPETPAPSTERAPVAAGTWERHDLPDPAPGVFAGAVPSDVIAFGDGYVAVGSVQAHCASDIAEPPPGCDAALEELPATQSAVVWLSEDARTWEVLPYQGEFELGRMEHVATDGSRIVASGVIVTLDELRPVVWVSDDGRGWELVDEGGPMPEHLVSTSNGFIGTDQTDEGPQFLASDDGRAWRPLTSPGELGPGEVMGLDVGMDGMTVVATGATYVYSDNDELTITGASWLSRDGVLWERAPENEGHDGAWMSSAAQTDAGWVAVGLDQTVEVEPADESAVWTSPDGLAWTRVDSASVPVTPYGYIDHVAWTGDEIVATGTLAGESGSVVGFWLSGDGTMWATVEDEAAKDVGTPTQLVGRDGWVLAVGSRSTAPDHWVGVVWLGAP